MLSIIIPVYNKASYLPSLIEKIISYKNSIFEFIIVNDGSTDGSFKLLSQIDTSDSDKIKVINTKNGGVSSARNIGIKNVSKKSEMIGFWDPDDDLYLDKLYDCYEVYLEELSRSQLVIFSTINSLGVKNQASFIGQKYLNDEFKELYQKNIIHQCWNKIYKTKLIVENNILFELNLDMGEDLKFNMNYLKYVEKVFFSCNILYKYYVFNDDSLTSSYNDKSFEQFKSGISGINDFVHSRGISFDELNNRYIYSLNDRVRNLKKSKLKLTDQVKMFKRDFSFVNSLVHKMLPSRMSYKYKFFYFLIKFNLSNTYFFINYNFTR